MRNISVLLLVAISFLGFSQDKLLTIQDAITGYHLYPRGLSDAQWLPGGKWFSQTAVLDGKQTIEVQEIAVTKGRNISVLLEDINATLSEDAKLKRLPRANWISAREFQFMSNRRGYAYNIEEKNTRRLKFENTVGVNSPQYFADGSGMYGETLGGFGYCRNNKEIEAIRNLLKLLIIKLENKI